MTTGADKDDLAGLLCCPHKRCMETIFIPAIGALVEFLFYLYGYGFWCILFQLLAPLFMVSWPVQSSPIEPKRLAFFTTRFSSKPKA